MRLSTPAAVRWEQSAERTGDGRERVARGVQGLGQASHHPQSDALDHDLARAWTTKSSLQLAFQLADFKQRDTSPGSSQAPSEAQRVAAECRSQALIKAVGARSQPRDQSRPDSIRSIGIEVNLQRVPTPLYVAMPHRPVRTRIVGVVNAEKRRLVEADIQPSRPTQGLDPAGHQSVPEEFIAHPRIHGGMAVQTHRCAAGSGTSDALGVGVTSQHEDRHADVGSIPADPVLGEGASLADQRIMCRCHRGHRHSRPAQGKSQARDQSEGATVGHGGGLIWGS